MLKVTKENLEEVKKSELILNGYALLLYHSTYKQGDSVLNVANYIEDTIDTQSEDTVLLSKMIDIMTNQQNLRNSIIALRQHLELRQGLIERVENGEG